MNRLVRNGNRRLKTSAKAALLCAFLMPLAAPLHANEIKTMLCSFTKKLCGDALPGGKLNPAYAMCQKLRDVCWSGNSAELDDEALIELFQELQEYAEDLAEQERQS